MELRIIRLVVTMLFLASATMTAVTLAGWKGWLVGAVAFGTMMVLMWRGEADAEADVRVLQAQARLRERRPQPDPVPRPNTAGEDGTFDPTQSW